MSHSPSITTQLLALLSDPELSPADAEIFDHLGDAYWRAGREAEARFQWTAALRLKPGPEREQSLRGKLEKGLPALPAASLASRP